MTNQHLSEHNQSKLNTLQIRQAAIEEGRHEISLVLRRPGLPDQEASINMQFAFPPQEQESLRWYLEDYLERADVIESVQVRQVEELIRTCGEELFTKIFTAGQGAQALWSSVHSELADLRIEISFGIAEATSIPWELIRDPATNSPICLRAKSFVHVQLNPNSPFLRIPGAEDGRIRVLYVACRPGGAQDVEFRAVANRLLQGLAEERDCLHIKALRPPTFEQLQSELIDAKERGRAYHIVHFDGHGVYADLTQSTLAPWLNLRLVALSVAARGAGKQGYLLFEHSSATRMRPVDGQTLGQVLRDGGVPCLVLNACQSAMSESFGPSDEIAEIHDEVRAIGSLAQTVVDQGIPAVLGMRYSIFVVTAAQFIQQLYAALAKGRSFGQAASEGRKHLESNPERWLGLEARGLQDWFVPTIYEAAPINLVTLPENVELRDKRNLDPTQLNSDLLRFVPETGFIGRDETILALDRAFDDHRLVLLHAYAGHGKSATAVEFARWYANTGGLGEQPTVFVTSFETHTDLNSVLRKAGDFLKNAFGADVDWTPLNELALRRQALVKFLRRYPILWIWDNVEPVTGFPEGAVSDWTETEQDELRYFLKQLKEDALTKVRILITSRRDEQGWLGDMPKRIAMPPMSFSDAAKLALSMGRKSGIDEAEIASWKPLLDYAAGNPLTLRILISQAISNPRRDAESIAKLVEAIRGGEAALADPDESHGRDRSLTASLNYGFRRAFRRDELAIIATLHLFQGTVFVDILYNMGHVNAHAVDELRAVTKQQLVALLKRAQSNGLLERLAEGWFRIHPALPWFVGQLFKEFYDGNERRSSASAVLYGWVAMVGAASMHLKETFDKGRAGAIQILEREEPNLLHASQQARKYGWWDEALRCLAGLESLYLYQGRTKEWRTLIWQITPYFMDSSDNPLPGRKAGYFVLMQWRVILTWRTERDVKRATRLQQRLINIARADRMEEKSIRDGHPIAEREQGRLGDLAACLCTLGQILSADGEADCLDHYDEALNIYQQIGDVSGEAMVQFNIGQYHQHGGHLDGAEKAYQRALQLYGPQDRYNHNGCFFQLGIVSQLRFKRAVDRRERGEIIRAHAEQAERYYLNALDLCPEDSVVDLAAIHHQLGCLYGELRLLEPSCRELERAIQLAESSENQLDAGKGRYGIALTCFEAAQREQDRSQRHSLLARARAYAESALRDYRACNGHAVSEQAKCQELLKEIDREGSEGVSL